MRCYCRSQECDDDSPSLGCGVRSCTEIGQCGNRSKIVISWVSVLASVLVAKWASASANWKQAEEVGVVSQWNHRSIQTVWLLLWANPSKTCVTEWGSTYDESAGWGSAPDCLQEMKLGSSPLTSLVHGHFYLNIWLPYCVVYRALACFWAVIALGSRAN